MPAPASWPEVESLLARLLGGGEEGSAAARDFLVSAIRARWRTETLYDLTSAERRIALYALSQAVHELHGLPGDLAFYLGVRQVVAGEIARRLEVDPTLVEGPEYRLGPDEMDRPTYAEWVALADFSSSPAA